MKKTLYLFGFQVLICSLLILKISPLYATPITLGSLSSNDDASTQIISDSQRGYLEWLRWDQTAGYTYAEADEVRGTIAGLRRSISRPILC